MSYYYLQDAVKFVDTIREIYMELHYKCLDIFEIDDGLAHPLFISVEDGMEEILNNSAIYTAVSNKNVSTLYIILVKLYQYCDQYSTTLYNNIFKTSYGD